MHILSCLSTENQQPRVLYGARATVGWEVTRDRAVYWCDVCGIFHISTGHSRGDVHGCCPKMDEGEKVATLTCGPVPIAILWSIYRKFLNADARRELEQAFEVLDALIEAEQVAS
jgi:hypothetical protein